MFLQFHHVNQIGILLKFDGKSDKQRDIRLRFT